MYSTPAWYRSMVTVDHNVDVYMSLGINIDNTAADDISGYTSSLLPMSNTEQLTDANYDMQEDLLSFEGDGIATASGGYAPPITSTAYPPEVGVWSSAISDGTGALSFSLAISLSAEHTSALTIYTHGPSITAGSVTFHRTGYSDETVQLSCSEGRAVASGSHTYDSLTISITAIESAYHHVRIVELEFGDSITIGPDRVVGDVTYIDEIDPLIRSLPLSELDFTLNNVGGEYDADNPDTLFSDLKIGNPIQLSYTLYDSTHRITVPVGHFVIGERKGSVTEMRVTAYDVRWPLSEAYVKWSLSASESVGAAIQRILTAHEVAYDIAQAVYSIYPAKAHTFDDSTSVLDDLKAMAQAYGLYIKPNRRGVVMVYAAFPSDQYGTIPTSTMFSWPEDSQATQYNYVTVTYIDGDSTGQYTRDLRTSSGVARENLSVSNPLVVGQTMAIAVCNRLVAALYTKEAEVEWVCDPALDLFDVVGVHTRWTTTTPTSRKPVKREITYDAFLSERTKFIS